MKIVKGDLIALAKSGEFDVIIHGCNCYCQMGGGIAKTIKQNFPEAYRADLSTKKGDKKKLGTYSSVPIKRDGLDLIVINAYTQHEWWGKGCKADYKAIEKVFDLIAEDFSGKRIAYPLIGAGLAGGNWEIISDIINTSLAVEDYTLVKYYK